MAPRASSLTSDQRLTLTRAANALIPRARGMPAAGDEGLAHDWIDRTLAARADLTVPLVDVLRGLRRGCDAPALRELAEADSAGFDVLVVAVVATYYMMPSVRELIGYRGQEAGSVDVLAELALYVDEGLLEPVLRRGPIYRSPVARA